MWGESRSVFVQEERGSVVEEWGDWSWEARGVSLGFSEEHGPRHLSQEQELA